MGYSNEALYQMDTHTRAVEKIIPNDSTVLQNVSFCLDDSGVCVQCTPSAMGHGTSSR